MESQINDINQKVAEYFVVAGLPDKDPEMLEKCIPPEMEPPLEYKPPPPIDDLAVIFRSLGEEVPPGFTIIEHTPTGFLADLNHGSLRSPSVFLCYKRGRDKPPIVDIGIMYDGKERLIPGCEIIMYSPNNRPANVNNSGARTYITFRRASIKASPNELAVTDICIILTNKGETPPHAFMQISKNLNKGMLGSDVYICYKKSMCKANVISHKPTLISRYPAENTEDYSLPDIVPLFCLPMGATIESWHPCAKVPDPLFSTFVLTNNFGIKAYGAAITFYEKYPLSKLTPEQRSRLDLSHLTPLLGTARSPRTTVSATDRSAAQPTNGPGDEVPPEPGTAPLSRRKNASVTPRVRSRSRSLSKGANDEGPVPQANGTAPTGCLLDPSPRINPRRRISSVTRNCSPGAVGALYNAPAVYTNKAICLVSKWPFFTTFKKFLLFLYNVTQHRSSTIPIERYVAFFMHKIPFPSQSRPRILVQLPLSTTLSLGLPSFIPLSSTGASFTSLLRNMGPENTLNLLTAVLLEQKILIHSLRPAVLTSVGEALRMMIFPFQWQCSYIPLCPILLSQVLHAPVPYIIGVDSRYFDMYKRAPQDAISIDLDTNTITIPDYKKFMTYKLLPKKAAKVFRTTQSRLFEQIYDLGKPSSITGITELDEFKQMKIEESLEKAIQDSFIRFMACVLKGYQHFLLPLTKASTESGYDVKTLFDFQGFIRSRDKQNEKFFSLLTQTQMFCQFVQERSFVTTKDSSLTFFDECAERVDPHVDREEQSFLVEMMEDAEGSDHTIFIPPPDTSGLPRGVIYKYNEFPSMDPTLFYLPPDDWKDDLVQGHCVGDGGELLPPHDNQESNTGANPESHGAKYKGPVCKFVTNPANEGSPLRASPVITRTKHEIKSGKKIAKMNFDNPAFKARFLLNSCLSLWFLYLPAYVKSCRNSNKALYCAFDILISMPKLGLRHANEMCYRVLLQLCGVYHDSTLAVRVLKEMKRVGLKPNAVTYGFYNKVVLESDSTRPINLSARLSWCKLRNTLQAVRRFRHHGRHRRLSLNRKLEYFAIDAQCPTNLIPRTKSSIATKIETERLGDQSPLVNPCAVMDYLPRRWVRKLSRPRRGSTNSEDETYSSEPEGTLPRPKLKHFHSAPSITSLLQEGRNDSATHRNREVVYNSSPHQVVPKGPAPPRPPNSVYHQSNVLISSTKGSADKPFSLHTTEYTPPATYFSLGGIVSSLITGHQKRAVIAPHPNPSVYADHPTSPQCPSQNYEVNASTNSRILARIGGGIDRVLSRIESFNHSLSTSSIVDDDDGERVTAGTDNYTAHISDPNFSTQHRPDVDDARQHFHSTSHHHRKMSASTLPTNLITSSFPHPVPNYHASRATGRFPTGRNSLTPHHSADDPSSSILTTHVSTSASIGSSLFRSAADLVTGLREAITTSPPPPYPLTSSTGSLSLSLSAPHGSTSSSLNNDNIARPGNNEQQLSPRHRALASLKAKTAGLAATLLSSKPRLFIDHAVLADYSAFYARNIEEASKPLYQQGHTSNVPTDHPDTANFSTEVLRNLGVAYGMIDENEDDADGANNITPYELPDISSRTVDLQGNTKFIIDRSLGYEGGNMALSSTTDDYVPWHRQRYEGTRLLRDDRSRRTPPHPPRGTNTADNVIGHKMFRGGRVRYTTGMAHLSRSSFSSLTGINIRKEEPPSHWVPVVRGDGLRAGPGHRRVASLASAPTDPPTPRLTLGVGDGTSGHPCHRLSSRSLVESATPFGGFGHPGATSTVVPDGKGGSAGSSVQKFVHRIMMSTCTQCPRCMCYVYEENIMAGWYPDDSNLNTRCKFCRQNFVPSLKIYLKRVPMQNPSAVKISCDLRLNRTYSFKGSMDTYDSVNNQDLYFTPFKSKDPSNLTTQSVDEGLDINERSSTNATSFITTSNVFTPPPSVSARASLVTQNVDPTGHDVNLTRLLQAFHEYKSSINATSTELDDNFFPPPPDTKIDDPLAAAATGALSDNEDDVSSGGIEFATTNKDGTDSGVRVDESANCPTFTKFLADDLRPTFTYQYLSPLVLEKEFENILENEGGESCLLDTAFVHSHPCVYWNLVWYMNRLDLPTFLPQLTTSLFDGLDEDNKDRVTGKDICETTPSYYGAQNKINNPKNAVLDIISLWDDISMYDLTTTGLPIYLYYLLNQTDEYDIQDAIGPSPWRSLVTSKKFGQVLEAIEKNDLTMALLPLLNNYVEVKKNDASLGKMFSGHSSFPISVYRQLLWISLLVYENLNYEAFDYEYRRAFDCIKHQFPDILQASDIPYPDSSVLFRNFFCRSLTF